jgi:16S rRNA (adenine1518-N6/adenine1519-N6)-dimethyltransferase
LNIRLIYIYKHRCYAGILQCQQAIGANKLYDMNYVKPKKHLGQHFLKNEEIALRIAGSLLLDGPCKVLEIGPGTGVLTKYLTQRPGIDFKAVELDRESIAYLKAKNILEESQIIEGDFLHLDFDVFFDGQFCITGNYPYNISSQILFKVFYSRDRIPQLTGMFQKEVAKRVCSGPNSREYGILSVLLQAFYTLEYLFTVDENEFNPPPKVKSGVLRMTRNGVTDLGCSEKLFVSVVKAGFGQRRKTLRNSTKAMLQGKTLDSPVLDKRAEQLSVKDFVELTNAIELCLKS